jgi:hypothetical protein
MPSEVRTGMRIFIVLLSWRNIKLLKNHKEAIIVNLLKFSYFNHEVLTMIIESNINVIAII